jgi:hypothetical protein
MRMMHLKDIFLVWLIALFATLIVTIVVFATSIAVTGDYYVVGDFMDAYWTDWWTLSVWGTIAIVIETALFIAAFAVDIYVRAVPYLGYILLVVSGVLFAMTFYSIAIMAVY